MSRRTLGFVVFALAVSAGCVRLGFWQLHRLEERRALNTMLAGRLSAPAQDVRVFLRGPADASYRRASSTGVYDFTNEFAVGGRTHEGSPGVNIITPLRIAGTDTAILVNRGWVYAPDAMIADLTRWREPAAARVSGYLLDIPRGQRGPVTTPSSTRSLRHLDRDSLARRLPYPIAPFVLVVTDVTSGAGDSVPARLPPPLLDEGPHLGYAIQWFAFALIGVLGLVFAVRADRRARRSRGRHPALSEATDDVSAS